MDIHTRQYKQIKACAANGKHVFCEKPIATDVPETIEAINACKTAGVKLMTALQRRFDPNFARVKIAIADREVGDLIQVRPTTVRCGYVVAKAFLSVVRTIPFCFTSALIVLCTPPKGSRECSSSLQAHVELHMDGKAPVPAE